MGCYGAPVTSTGRSCMRALYVVAAVLLAQSALAQEKLVGSNVDVRTGLTFKVSDGVVQKMLPEGWEVNSPTAGPTKGSNVNLTLIDQIMAQDPEGKALNPFRGAALSIPAKKKGTETAGTMVFAGLMTPPTCPAPTALSCRRTRSSSGVNAPTATARP